MIFDSKPLLTVFLLLSFCWSQGQSLPSFELTSEWREKIKSTQRKRRDERLKSFIPKVKQALRKNSNKRKDAAKYLGVKPSYLSKIMLQTKDQVDWQKEFPSPFHRHKK